VADSTHFARQSRLWQQNIGSRQAYELAELKLATSRNALRELQQLYARTQGELVAQLALARTTLDQRQRATEDYLIRAESAGTVYELLVEEGEAVTIQTPLARIGSTDDFHLRLSVDEADIVDVKPGQEVVVALDAYPGRTFPSRITRVLTHKDVDTQTYSAEATFTDPPDRLFERMIGEANIIVRQRKDVLTLPTEFISAASTVRTQEGVQTVVTGVTDYRRTEIISGIDTSETVYQMP
jgi:HlyD family secretion protein